MKLTKKRTYFIRNIAGKIIAGIVFEALTTKYGNFATEDPKIYLATNETWSNDDVKWAKFDCKKKNENQAVDNIEIGQILSAVYDILHEMEWPKRMVECFSDYRLSSVSLLSNPNNKIYYMDVTDGYSITGVKQSKGIKDAICADTFEPIGDIWGGGKI